MRQNWLKDKPSPNPDTNDCVLPGLSVSVLDSTVASRKSNIQCEPPVKSKESLTSWENLVIIQQQLLICSRILV